MASSRVSHASVRRCARPVPAAAAAVILCAFALCLRPALAGPGPEARVEIDHLLAFILESSCAFVRNGREYDAERAHRHVLRKYDYFEGEIETAEDFIEYSATRSTMSGKPYQLVCDGRTRASADVLLGELERFRKAGN